MSKFDGTMLSDLVPYTAGEQPKDIKYVKLNTNENPYAPSPKVLDALRNFDYQSLKLYPDPEATELKNAISKQYGVKTEQVFCGNSSDEIIAMAFMAFFSGKTVAFPDITYSFYPVWCKIFNVKQKIVPLRADWTINANAFPQNAGGLVVCNPNAPTGIAMRREEIEKILQKHADALVLVDEAYIDFGGESCVELIKKYDNILVVQTLSKSRALAGMRVGFAIGDSALVKSLDVVKNSFNSYTLDRLAISVATEAISDTEYFENCCRKVIGTRENTAFTLKFMGFEVLPSSSNFIFVSPPTGFSAENMYEELKRRGVLVRFWKKERIENWLRISIGTDAEMKVLIDEIRAIIS